MQEKPKPKPIDKWDFEQGKWVRIGWKDIDRLKKDKMIAQQLDSQVSVRKITTTIYNKPFCVVSKDDDSTLLAIRYMIKNDPAEFKHETYLSDLFRGKVYIRIGD
jgi:hypothetical protein